MLQICSNLRFFFVSLQSHFVLYTLTERKIKFSYNNRVYIGFQKVKGHISKRINKVTQHRSLSVSFSSVQYFGHLQLISLVLILFFFIFFVASMLK